MDMMEEREDSKFSLAPLMELDNPEKDSSLVRKLSFLSNKLNLRFVFTGQIPTHASALESVPAVKAPLSFFNKM